MSGKWLLIILLAGGLGFVGGYKLSASTGTEPGYFDAVEAAGYGGGGEKIEGISDEMQQYYQDLSTE